jgi:hypothetical protein
MFYVQCSHDVTLFKILLRYEYAFFSFQVRERLSQLRCGCCPDNTVNVVWLVSGGGLRFVQILNIIACLGSRAQNVL